MKMWLFTWSIFSSFNKGYINVKMWLFTWSRFSSFSQGSCSWMGDSLVYMLVRVIDRTLWFLIARQEYSLRLSEFSTIIRNSVAAKTIQQKNIMHDDLFTVAFFFLQTFLWPIVFFRFKLKLQICWLLSKNKIKRKGIKV
jgi:hypothetical protein